MENDQELKPIRGFEVYGKGRPFAPMTKEAHETFVAKMDDLVGWLNSQETPYLIITVTKTLPDSEKPNDEGLRGSASNAGLMADYPDMLYGALQVLESESKKASEGFREGRR